MGMGPPHKFGRGALRVGLGGPFVIVGIVQIGAEFRNVTMHVVQAKSVGRIGTDGRRSSQTGTLEFRSIGVPAVTIRCAPIKFGAEMKWCICARTTRVFPFSFRR